MKVFSVIGLIVAFVFLLPRFSVCRGMPLSEKVISEIKGLSDERAAELLYVPEWARHETMQSRTMPVTERSSVFLLVDFDDNEHDPLHDWGSYDEMIFSEDTFPTGSMKDYYDEISYEQFTLSGEIAPEWFRVPQTYAYYVDGQRGFGSYPRNAQKMVEDAIAAADPSVDFSEYDCDSDGYVDALFVVHAGPGYEETGNQNMIHSHMSSLRWSPNGAYETDDGVSVDLYSVEPEEHAGGDIISIGVFCHEFGHVLGLPDFYDYGYDSEGVGNWALMAGGSWGGDGYSPEKPVHMTAYGKYELGWLDPVVLSQDASGVEIHQVETSPAAYRINIHRPKEYFLIENRQKTGFDENLYSGGLLIYHVDKNMPNNDTQCCGSCPEHYLLAVEQADGECDMEYDHNRGDGGDPFPGNSNNRLFDTASNPNSRDYAGIPTWLTLFDISDSGEIMQFDVSFQTTGAFLVYEGAGVDDSDGGDGDGRADAGETVELSVILKNYGLTVENVCGQLTTSDPAAEVNDGLGEFGDFGEQASGDNSDDPFSVTISSEATYGQKINFILELTGSGGYERTVDFDLIVMPLPIDTAAGWMTANAPIASCGALGDVDGDGLEDLAMGLIMGQNQVYLNQGGELSETADWSTEDGAGDYPIRAGFADLEDDGYPELFFANILANIDTFDILPSVSAYYDNPDGTLSTTASWQSPLMPATGLGLSDVDGDGDIDVTFGCYGVPSVMYENAGGNLSAEPAWTSSFTSLVQNIVMADLGGDGFPDMITVGAEEPVYVYENRDGTLPESPTWFSTVEFYAFAVAAGDYDADGDPDVAVGTFEGQNHLLENIDGVLTETPVWSSEDAVSTFSLKWSDVDLDGYPELISGNMNIRNMMPEGAHNGIYYNESGSLTTYRAWESEESVISADALAGDLELDGDPDLISIDAMAPSKAYANRQNDFAVTPTPTPACPETGVYLNMPGHYFAPNDPCSLEAKLCNGELKNDVVCFILLDIFGEYWCAPSWININEGIDAYWFGSLPQGPYTFMVIEPFQWPDIPDALDGLCFRGAMLNENYTDIMGRMDNWEFGFGPE